MPAIFFTVLLYAPLGMRAYSVCQEQNINSNSGDKRALHVFVRFMRVAYLRQILAASTRYTPCRTFVLVQILSEKKRKHNTTHTIWMGCGIFFVFCLDTCNLFNARTVRIPRMLSALAIVLVKTETIVVFSKACSVRVLFTINEMTSGVQNC